MYYIAPISTYMLDSAAPLTYFLVNTGTQAGSLGQAPFEHVALLSASLVSVAVIAAGAVIYAVRRKSSSGDRPRYNYNKELEEIRRSAKTDK